MSKFVKELITTELRERYQGVRSACVVDLTGLDVQAQEKLRRTVRAKSGRIEVVKNSLARRALRGAPLGPLTDAMDGPCALVTGDGDSIIDIAKTLVESAREFTKLKFRHAIVDGDPSLLTVADVARMRNRGEVLAELAMLIASPTRRLAGCLGGPAGRVAGCVKTVADKEAA